MSEQFPEGQYPASIFSLTNDADTITTGKDGHAEIIATNGTLSAGDHITPSGHHNMLVLSGAGTFDLSAPTDISNIALVKADSTADQTIALSNKAMTLHAGNGNDVITSLSGNEHIALGKGHDAVTLGTGKTELSLGNGTDTVTTGTGKATIHAGHGLDSITSDNSGSLSVTAGDGTTKIAFGTGADTLHVEHGKGTVAVTGFVAGSDSVDLSHLGIKSDDALTADSTIASDQHGGTAIAFSHGPTVDLVGISSVSAKDFTFASDTTTHDQPVDAFTAHYAGHSTPHFG